MTGTDWNQYSGGNVSLDWGTIKSQLATNAADATLYPYGQNVQYVGLKTWSIDQSDNLYTDSLKSVIFTGLHETWLVTARMWGGTLVDQYYYTYDSNNKIEVWVLNNAGAAQNALSYIFERAYGDGPLPEHRSSTGDTLASPALELGLVTMPPTVEVTTPTKPRAGTYRSATP